MVDGHEECRGEIDKIRRELLTIIDRHSECEEKEVCTLFDELKRLVDDLPNK